MPEQGLGSETPALRLDRVTLSYGPGADVLADASLSLPRGSLTLLTGASGAGKSSLLRLAYLGMRPTRGRVCLFGVDTSRLRRRDLTPLRRRIGIIFQEFRLLDHLSAYENVALPLRVHGAREASYRDDVVELLSWVGLGDRLHARPATLSGGEKQRVAIARAVIVKPDLILADEPTGNVDRDMGERLLHLFRELNRRLSTTILIATHDLSLAHSLGADGVRLADGMLMRMPEQAMRPDTGAT